MSLTEPIALQTGLEVRVFDIPIFPLVYFNLVFLRKVAYSGHDFL